VKKLIIVILILLCSAPAWAADYIVYIDSTASAGGNGTIGTPWNAFSSINWTTATSAITAGSVVNINLKRGSLFRTNLAIGASGVAGRPLVVQAYGTGNKPVINGADIVTSWSASGAGLGSTWQATCGATAGAIFLVNGTPFILGASATTLNDQEYFQSGTTLYFRNDAGNPTTLGLVTELSQRDPVTNNNHPYVTFSNIEFRNANANAIAFSNVVNNQTVTDSDFYDCAQSLSFNTGANTVARCRFIRGGTAQQVALGATGVSADISYCLFKDSTSRGVRSQYGTTLSLSNCTFYGMHGASYDNSSAAMTATLTNIIIAGGGSDSNGNILQSTAGTVSLSNSVLTVSRDGSGPTGVTIGSNVTYADPLVTNRGFTGLLSWSTDDGDYIYWNRMGTVLRGVFGATGATLADYSTTQHSAPQIAAMQAAVAAGDEVAGHTRNGVGNVVVLTAFKIYGATCGTSTATVRVASNHLIVKVDGSDQYDLDLTNVSYDALGEVTTYLNSKACTGGGTISITTDADTAKANTKSASLADLAETSFRVASGSALQLSFDSTKYWTEEIVNSRTDIETFIGGGYTAPVFIYPQGGYSAGLISFLIANGFTGARVVYTAASFSTQLKKLNQYQTVGMTSTTAQGMLVHISMYNALTDSIGGQTFTGTNLGSYVTQQYGRLPVDFYGAATFNGTTSRASRTSITGLDYTTADWSVGMMAHPVALTGNHTLWYHGDASGASNYSKLWISSDGAVHFTIIAGGSAVVSLSTAAGVMTAGNTKAVGVRQQLGSIDIMVGSNYCTSTSDYVVADTVGATTVTSVVPGAGSASYGGAMYLGASYDGTTYSDYYNGHMNSFYIAKNTARLAIGMANAVTSNGGLYVTFMHHADVPYDVIRNYADAIKWAQNHGANVLVKTHKDAYAYITTQGYKSSDGAYLSWKQTDASNYVPQATSPAVDTGTNLGYSTDLAGTAVPYNSIPDMGAYEYFPTTVNGACGTNNTGSFDTLTSATANDCATGTVTSFTTGSGPWTWQCVGSGTGHTDSGTCSASVNSYAVSTTGANATFTPSSASVNFGGTTTLAVAAVTNYSITAVSGCSGSWNSGTGIFTTGTMSANCTVTATAAINSFTVSTAGANATFTPSSASVNYGSTTTISVAPAIGYAISGVTGCGGSWNSGSGVFTTGAITGACTVTAATSILQETATPSAGANGSLGPATAQTVNYGATVAFTVTPAACYSIGTVTGCSGTLVGSTYTTGAMTANCTVSATFTSSGTTYTVTPSTGANGTISPSSPQTIACGSPATFTVTPSTNYWASVGGTCGGTLAGTTYTTGAITSACSVSATFAAISTGTNPYGLGYALDFNWY